MVKVCDCFPELKAVTDARERRYRAHPDKPAPEGPRSFVEVKVTSIGQLNESVDCKRSGHKFIISEPVHVGGQNVAPTPLEFLLSGAVGCYAAVFAFYAAKLGVDLRKLRGGGAHRLRRARPHDRGRAVVGVPEGDHRHQRGERCAGGQAPRGRAALVRGLPRHQHVARAGAGGDAAQADAAGGRARGVTARARRRHDAQSQALSGRPLAQRARPVRHCTDREGCLHRRI